MVGRRKRMPKKGESNKKEVEENLERNEDEIMKLNRMLGAVLEYISDENVEVIDFEYLLNHTDGLREWWSQYLEKNREKIVKEIKETLDKLSLDELQQIREQINENVKKG